MGSIIRAGASTIRRDTIGKHPAGEPELRAARDGARGILHGAESGYDPGRLERITRARPIAASDSRGMCKYDTQDFVFHGLAADVDIMMLVQ